MVGDGHHRRRVKPVTWKREDAAYAVAAVAALALDVYFSIGNFGLVPTPFGPGRAEAGQAIDVPRLPVPAAPAASPRAASVPHFSTSARPSPSASGARTPAAADRTPPRVA